MLAGACANEVVLWSLTNRAPTQLARWQPEIPLASGVTFSGDGKRLIVGGLLDSLHCWDIANPETPSPLPCFKGSSAPAVVSPDGKWLVASAPDDPSVRLWNLETGNRRQPLGRVASTIFASRSRPTAVSGIWPAQRRNHPCGTRQASASQ